MPLHYKINNTRTNQMAHSNKTIYSFKIQRQSTTISKQLLEGTQVSPRSRFPNKNRHNTKYPNMNFHYLTSQKKIDIDSTNKDNTE